MDLPYDIARKNIYINFFIIQNIFEFIPLVLYQKYFNKLFILIQPNKKRW